ncbi:hypothetical protein OU995_09085 [Roseateles sp. SL47]|uniref:hypothetical protein n=1 Tax=Roseateles sp. SL47 TaxID=2995138 RepID=UPI002270D5CF|nr:hypothetical protein [Roseateles sp. SL47]WAC74830.1 hypothetical protein OU995_09085 [Roseateles sp. SL47]
MLLSLLPMALAAHAAQDVEIGCQRLRIALAPALDAQVVERDWGSGEPHQGPNATLELVGCNGKVLSQLPLAAPLARLDPQPVRGAPRPTYLVSADLTAEAGSYNGPLTSAVEVVSDHLQVAEAKPAKGKPVPIQLGLTGKSAWQRVQGRSGESLLAVRSQREAGEFKTTYARYHVVGKAWVVSSRTRPGLWESDGDFPAETEFPGPRAGRNGR